MEIIISIVIWSLIVYRVASDIADMDGPFEVFVHLRSWVYEHMPQWVFTGISCAICISWWLTGILVLVTGDWRLSAVAGVVRLIVDWRNRS
jgi:spore maturation protein SpmA